MVEYGSPKPGVVGSSPTAPAKERLIMINPFKFIQEVKQEAFRVTWPTGKETATGAIMVVALATIAAIFFLLLDQIYKYLLNILLTINF